MPLIRVAVDYIEAHRADASDAEIARALTAQGFSEETVSAALRAAGGRPAGPASPAGPRRVLVRVLVAACALLSIGSVFLWARNFRQASRAARFDGAR